MHAIIFFIFCNTVLCSLLCLFIGQRIMKKLDSMAIHFEGWLENIRSDLYDFETHSTEEHSILEDKILMSCRSNEQTAQAYDDLTRDVIKLMFGQGEASPDPAEKE